MPLTLVTTIRRSSPVLDIDEVRKLLALVTNDSITVTDTAPMTMANTVRVVRSFWRPRLRQPVRN